MVVLVFCARDNMIAIFMIIGNVLTFNTVISFLCIVVDLSHCFCLRVFYFRCYSSYSSFVFSANVRVKDKETH